MGRMRRISVVAFACLFVVLLTIGIRAIERAADREELLLGRIESLNRQVEGLTAQVEVLAEQAETLAQQVRDLGGVPVTESEEFDSDDPAPPAEPPPQRPEPAPAGPQPEPAPPAPQPGPQPEPEPEPTEDEPGLIEELLDGLPLGTTCRDLPANLPVGPDHPLDGDGDGLACER